MFFKVIHNKECHVYNSKGESSYKTLQKYIEEVFKQLPSKYHLTYFDDEDEITLACESDFDTMRQLSQKTNKIYIQEVDESYYDETQKVVLDDEAVDMIEEKMEELKISDSEEHSEISQPEASKAVQIEADLTTQISPVEEEKPNISVSDTQPQIIEEKTQKIEEFNPILDQSEISQVSQITEADIEEKFREMIPEFMEKVKDSLLKKSTVQNENSQKAKIVHNHVTCDECGQRNIEGVRYKCAVCADFDLCEKCEVASTHDHPFLKIKHPGQTPYKIIAIVRDDQENSFEVNGNRVHIPQIPFVNELFNTFCQRPQRPEGHHGRFGGHHGFGHGKGRSGNGCPYMNKKKNEEMKEEKMEQKCEPQKKTKIEEEKPVEQKVESQVEPKVEEKVENKIVIEQKQQAPKKRETMQIEKDSQTEKIIENAKYLFASLDGCVEISQGSSYDFSVKHPRVTKEQLLELYFSQMH